MTKQTVAEDIIQARAKARLMVDAARIRAALQSMADAITLRLGDCNPLMLCVLNGGIYPTGALMPLLNG